MSNILTEAEIKRQIKIEVIKEAVYRSIDHQIRESIANWLSSKIPGSSEQQMQKALSLVSREEILNNLDLNDFVASIANDIVPKIKGELSDQIASLIAQSISKVAADLEQEV